MCARLVWCYRDTCNVLAFVVWLCREENTSYVLGFAYGYTGEAGQWWHDLVVRKLTLENAEHWMTNVFEVVELAVRPTAHGRGLWCNSSRHSFTRTSASYCCTFNLSSRDYRVKDV